MCTMYVCRAPSIYRRSIPAVRTYPEVRHNQQRPEFNMRCLVVRGSVSPSEPKWRPHPYPRFSVLEKLAVA
jgi:hypothetical protein